MKPHGHDEAAGDMPAFLCRLCHPEMNLKPDRKRELEKAEKKAWEKRVKLERKQRELANAERDLAAKSTPKPREGSVNYKIAVSLVIKVKRLRSELDRMLAN